MRGLSRWQMASQLHFTSWGVNGDPSWKTTPRRSLNTYCLPSRLTVLGDRWDESGWPPAQRGGICPTRVTRGQRRREERPAMEHSGIDVHKKESQICLLAEGGELVEQRIRTE